MAQDVSISTVASIAAVAAAKAGASPEDIGRIVKEAVEAARLGAMPAQPVHREPRETSTSLSVAWTPQEWTWKLAAGEISVEMPSYRMQCRMARLRALIDAKDTREPVADTPAPPIGVMVFESKTQQEPRGTADGGVGLATIPYWKPSLRMAAVETAGAACSSWSKRPVRGRSVKAARKSDGYEYIHDGIKSRSQLGEAAEVAALATVASTACESPDRKRSSSLAAGGTCGNEQDEVATSATNAISACDKGQEASLDSAANSACGFEHGETATSATVATTACDSPDRKRSSSLTAGGTCGNEQGEVATSAKRASSTCDRGQGASLDSAANSAIAITACESPDRKCS